LPRNHARVRPSDIFAVERSGHSRRSGFYSGHHRNDGPACCAAYKAVESSLLWSVVAAFIALRAAGTAIWTEFICRWRLALIVALIETSVRHGHTWTELTQLPSRRSLNEALLKLGETYSIACWMLTTSRSSMTATAMIGRPGVEAGCFAAVAYYRRPEKLSLRREEFAIVFPNKASEKFLFTSIACGGDRAIRVYRGGADRRRKGKSGIGRGSKKQTNVTVSIGLAATNR